MSRRRGLLSVGLVLLALAPIALLAALATGCSEATGSLKGGELLVVDPESNAACAADAGATWPNLYACYFGPNGQATCAGQNACHGSFDDPGGSLGFVCGDTPDSCYKGFTTYPWRQRTNDAGDLVVVTGDAGAVASAKAVELNLRGPGLAGQMPCDLTLAGGIPTCDTQGRAYGFSSADIARINAWIDAGAPPN
jgi:hypothetical protein